MDTGDSIIQEVAGQKEIAESEDDDSKDLDLEDTADDSEEAEHPSDEEREMMDQKMDEEVDKCYRSLRESQLTVQECEKTHGDIKRAFDNQIIRDLSCPQLFNDGKTWRQLKARDIYRRAQQMEAEFYDYDRLDKYIPVRIPKPQSRVVRYEKYRPLRSSKSSRYPRRSNYLNSSYHERLQPKSRMADDEFLDDYDLSSSLPIFAMDDDSFLFGGNSSPQLATEKSHEVCEINQVDGEGKTSLHYAAKHGRIATVTSLLRYGAFVNVVDDDGKSPLTYAVEHGFTAIVKDLISRGAFVNQKNLEKKTPLHVAAEDGRKVMVDLLLEYGASVFALDNKMKAPLHYAAEKNHISVVETLVNFGAPINQSDGDQRKPLHYAADRGFITMVESLLRRGASIDSLDKNLETPLFLAVQQGFEYVVHTLIRCRASVNCSNKSRQTPLHIATANGFMSIAMDLIRNKARLDCRDGLGRTPLILGIENKQLNLIDILLRHGAHVDVNDNRGRSALCCAVDTRDNDIIYMISKHELRAVPSSSDIFRRQLQLAIDKDCEFLGRTVWNHMIEKFTNFPGDSAGYRNLRITLQSLLDFTCSSFARAYREQLWKAVSEFRDERLDKPLIIAYVFLMPNERKPMYMGVPVVYRMHTEAQKAIDQDVSFSTTRLSGTSTPKR